MLVTKEPWTLHLYWDGRQGLGSLPKRDLELRHLSKAGPISSAKEQTGREKKKILLQKEVVKRSWLVFGSVGKMERKSLLRNSNSRPSRTQILGLNLHCPHGPRTPMSQN